LQRTTGDSLGMPLSKVNWSNYDLVVIDESHNFRNNDAFKEKETRYQKLMNTVIKQGVKTKVLMLSATPVNTNFADLKNEIFEISTNTAGCVHKPLFFIFQVRALKEHKPMTAVFKSFNVFTHFSTSFVPNLNKLYHA